MKLKYTIPLALAIWWIPIFSGLILGFVSSFLNKEYKKGIFSVLLSSIIASAFYIALAFYVLKVPILGNLLPTFAIIFSAIDTALSLLVFNFIFYKSSFSSITADGMYSEFYVSSREEVEDRLKELLINCGDPKLTLSEDKISVHRECTGYVVDYDIVEAGKNKYKVRLQVKKKYE